MRKTAILCSLLILILHISGSAAIGQSTDNPAHRIVGMWRLVSITTSGRVNPTRGKHPTGLIVYDKSGYMAVQIMPDRDRPKFSGMQPTPEEAKAALIGYTAYFGTHTVNPQAGTVTHHRKGNIYTNASVDAVRRYEFVGDDVLGLSPLENDNKLTWERVK